MSGAVDKAKEIVASTPGAFMPNQFDNAANAKAHYETTGPEIWDDMQGRIDAFVSAVGSGGTITGTGQFLRRCDPGIRVVAVEPKGSPVLSSGKAGPHKIQGIGAGFVPGTLDTSVYHEVMQVGNEEAAAMTRLVLKTDGVFVGISSAALLRLPFVWPANRPMIMDASSSFFPTQASVISQLGFSANNFVQNQRKRAYRRQLALR